jgi:hypothetical protein
VEIHCTQMVVCGIVPEVGKQNTYGMPWKYARRFFLYDDNVDNFTLAGKVFQRDTDLIIINPVWYIEVRASGAISLCTFSLPLI